jgi:hypothetical protein
VAFLSLDIGKLFGSSSDFAKSQQILEAMGARSYDKSSRSLGAKTSERLEEDSLLSAVLFTATELGSCCCETSFPFGFRCLEARGSFCETSSLFGSRDFEIRGLRILLYQG